MPKQILFISLIFLYSQLLFAQDWSREAKLPQAQNGFSSFHRQNIYQIEDLQLASMIERGYRHALSYPVTVTELLIPLKPLDDFFNLDHNDPIRRILVQFGRQVSPFKSTREIMHWLGVHEFPVATQNMPVAIPRVSVREMELGMGATVIEKSINGAQVEGLTFSCAACHSANVFGQKVMGLSNRFPRANEFFVQGKKLAPLVNDRLFQQFLKTSDEEVAMFKQLKTALKWVDVKNPQQLGLDTSLAQVALSLSRRAQDEHATKTLLNALHPRPNPLETEIADSKPMVWWNVKYKTRWLADGSIVAGNPIHTNFLWNEIGRGVDLKQLNTWLNQNQEKVKELTAAVFSSQAPHYTDFFAKQTIDRERAQRGEKHFVQSCQSCHGVYEKNWDTFKNTRVWYHEQTPVKNVGTDPKRYEGMQYFAKDLNRLKISRDIGTIVEPQEGYVPPPLEGIWIRWPYFHNNSIPNLCALLTHPDQRPKTFWTGEAIDPELDFDAECNGYPVGDKTPEDWKQKSEYLYDTSRIGLSNRGHYKMMLKQDGTEKYTQEEKMELIEFLKTL